MPYTKSAPPDAIKGLPSAAQDIFIAAYNSAYKQYDGDEEKTNATAWAAVKRKYQQDDAGNWAAKAAGAVEALRLKYADFIQEAGRRNAAMDSARIRKVIELCNELLSSEAPDEGKATEALANVEKELIAVLTLEVVKMEEGAAYPASAYAYAPDPDKPSTWSLRLKEGGQYSKDLLGRAAAALSPGGYRGQRAEIPAEVLPAVRRKIREGYRALDVPEADMPRWILETNKGVKDMARTLILETLDLREAKFNAKGEADIVVIKPGFNMSKERYYPETMLKKDYRVFENVKMYADHPTPTEEREKPERSVRDWVANLKNVHPATAAEAASLEVPDNTLLGRATVVEPWFKEKMDTIAEKGLLAEMGVSINAIGTGTIGEVDGHKTNIIEHIVRARSVDFVTEPGAGGGVSLYESNVLDVELIGIEALREHRPDLIQEVENSLKPEIQKEVKKNMGLETKVTELEEANTALKTENDELKTKVTEADKAKAVAETKAKLDEALNASELPEAARVRIRARFAEAQTDEGIAEAIKAEGEYIATITEGHKVKNLGPQVEDKKAGKESLTESFKLLGLSDEEAAIAAEGR